MDAKYSLLPYWLVTVEYEIWPATKSGKDRKIKWHFDFSVANTVKWVEIEEIARNMMCQQFKRHDWEIKKIALTTSTGG